MKSLPIILLAAIIISAASYTSLPLVNNTGSNRPPSAAIPAIEAAAVSIIPIEHSTSGNPPAFMGTLINYCAALPAVTTSLFIKKEGVSYDVATTNKKPNRYTPNARNVVPIQSDVRHNIKFFRISPFGMFQTIMY